MIWNDTHIRHHCQFNNLVAPYNPDLVNPASIDLRLGESYRLPHPAWGMHLSGKAITVNTRWGDERCMDANGIEVEPGQFILCSSLETVRIPSDAIAFLYSKSSTGRLGLEHLHAGLGDPGFVGQWTWEFVNVAPWPIQLVPGQKIMQMVVQNLLAPAQRDYSVTGRYQNQVGATPARETK